MNRIKKGDNVIIIAGKSKGAKGLVMKVKEDRVWVEGANFVKRHVKPNPRLQTPGGIIEKEASLHVSNVALLNPATQKADRVGFKFLESGNSDKPKKVRYFKSNGELVDAV